MEKIIGATGKFPEGKLNQDDEGEIRMAIGSENGKIIMNFGKPTAWIGFNPTQARSLANLLILKANLMEGKN